MNIEEELANCARILALADETEIALDDFWTEEVYTRGQKLLGLPMEETIYSEETWGKKMMGDCPPPETDPETGTVRVERTRPRANVMATVGFVAEALDRISEAECGYGLYTRGARTAGTASAMIGEIEGKLQGLFLELGKILDQPGEEVVVGDVDLSDRKIEKWREKYEAAKGSGRVAQ